MGEPISKKQPLRIYDSTKVELEKVIEKLVKRKIVAPEIVNSLVKEVQETIAGQAKAVGQLEMLKMKRERELDPEQQRKLLSIVKGRFEANMHRHEGMKWAKIQARLESSPEKMWSLNEMERTDGEPDVVEQDEETGEYIFYDCSKESPEGRRWTVYDKAAVEDWECWKELHPTEVLTGAIDMAAAMGIEISTPEQYKRFQQIENFDRESRSWLKTPDDMLHPDSILHDPCAFIGDRMYVGIRISRTNPHNRGGGWGFRGLLRV